MKIGNERFSVAWSRCHHDLKFSDFRAPQKCGQKSVPHVQHDYLCSFNQ